MYVCMVWPCVRWPFVWGIFIGGLLSGGRPSVHLVIGIVFCVFVYYLVVLWLSVAQYRRNRLPGKTCSRNDLLCVECDVLYLLIHIVWLLDNNPSVLVTKDLLGCMEIRHGFRNSTDSRSRFQDRRRFVIDFESRLVSKSAIGKRKAMLQTKQVAETAVSNDGQRIVLRSRRLLS